VRGGLAMPVRKTMTMGLAVLASLAAAVPGAAAAEAEEFIAPPPLLRDRPLDAYRHWDRPAAADSRPASDFTDNYANEAGDAFFFAPGVTVNRLDLSEPRIVLRGFGLANRQERATIIALRDGAPLTDVHGETNTVEIDLLAVDRVDIFRGGGGDLAIVGGNLGGAVNFVSPTGRALGRHRRVRGDGAASLDGEPGWQANAQLGGVSGDFDYFTSLTGRYESGFRDNNERMDVVLNSNIGYEFTPTFRTRFFFEGLRSDMELAGGLDESQLFDDPTAAMQPIVIGPLFPGGPIIPVADGADFDGHARELIMGRVSNATKFRLLGLNFDAGFHLARREVDSPQIDFVGVVDESADEWGVRLSAGRALRLFGLPMEARAGASYSAGARDVAAFENLGGEPGDELIDTRQKSANLAGFVEAAIRPFETLIINAGAKLINVDRELTVDDDIDEASFTGVAAKLGVLYEVTEKVQVFVNAVRTYEPPAFSELVSDNPEDINDLQEQDAFTYEAGVRGRATSWLGWDVTYFDSDIENEIINIDEPETNGLGDTLVNAATTSHRGVEAGVDISLLPGPLRRAGRSLTLRSAYAWNDFRFVDADPLDVDGNRLGGVPTHVYRGELRYAEDDRWYVGVNVETALGDYFVDHENLVEAPGYTLVGFTAGLKLSDALEIYASGENLTDEIYAAGLTPVLDQTAQEGRIFTPGVGASAYAGLRLRF